MQRRRHAAALQGASRIFMVSGPRQLMGMSDCFENNSPPQREEGQGWWVPEGAAGPTTPYPLLSQGGESFSWFPVPVSRSACATALESAFSPLQRLHRKEAPGETEPGQARAGEFAWGLAVVKLAVLLLA